MTLSRRTLAAALAMAPLGPKLIGTASARAQTAPLPVLATFSILGDVVRNVGGDVIALEVLVGPDGDAHTFEPSPSDIAKIADATLVFENGVAFEEWLDDVYASSDSAATRVAVAEGLPLLDIEGLPTEEGDDHEDEEHADEASPEAGHDGEEEHQEEEHEHGELDPHVWHDPRNMVAEVAVIRDALSAADPANAPTYAANADVYLAVLGETQAFLVAEVEKLPADRRKLVTSHDALGYFAAAYGFEIVGTALGSLSTETADPSGGELAELVEQIKAAGVPAIFVENIEGTDLMRQIAADAGVALAPPIYTDALGEPGGEAGTYVDLVRYNMTTIVAALGGA